MCVRVCVCGECVCGECVCVCVLVTYMCVWHAVCGVFVCVCLTCGACCVCECVYVCYMGGACVVGVECSKHAAIASSFSETLVLHCVGHGRMQHGPMCLPKIPYSLRERVWFPVLTSVPQHEKQPQRTQQRDREGPTTCLEAQTQM